MKTQTRNGTPQMSAAKHGPATGIEALSSSIGFGLAVAFVELVPWARRCAGLLGFAVFFWLEDKLGKPTVDRATDGIPLPYLSTIAPELVATVIAAIMLLQLMRLLLRDFR